jgi:catechol 2,3-dioxygenase-like lactoylglutathione lyase family enzyme
MLRVKDIKKSLEFYKNYFNMVLMDFLDFPEYKFAVYFLVSPKPNEHFEIPGSVEAHK